MNHPKRYKLVKQVEADEKLKDEKQYDNSLVSPRIACRGQHPKGNLTDTISPQIDDKTPVSDERIQHLYNNYAKSLTQFIRQKFGNGPPDPDDITQRTFQKLMERDSDNPIRNYKTFLWKTANNLLLSEKRSQSVRDRYEPEIKSTLSQGGGAIIDPQRVLLAEEQLIRVNEVMAKMPPKRQRAFVLHRIDGLSVAEVARRLGLSHTGARKHLSKAFLQLDNALKIKLDKK